MKKLARCLIILLLVGFVAPVSAQTVDYAEVPRDNRLYARDVSSNTATVQVVGGVLSNGYSAIELVVSRTGTVVSTQSQALFYSGGPTGATLTVTNSLQMWLRADAGVQSNPSTGVVTNWVDMSGSGNDAVRRSGTAGGPTYPTLVENALNGLPVVRFDPNGYSYFTFPRLTTIRTVFWVVKEDTVGAHFLLGDTSVYHFHRGASGHIWGAYDNANVYNGTTRLMGEVVDGTVTPLGTGYRMVSVVTLGNVTASTLSQDRINYGVNGCCGARSWDGDIAEVLIYDTALSATEVADVEAYLEDKYFAVNQAPFSFSEEIEAGFDTYAFEVSLVQGTTTTLVSSATNVVAGDVYLVQGQSNARAISFVGSANGNQGPYLRSFGTPSDNAGVVTGDPNWHPAEGDGNLGTPGAVGQWAIRMGRQIVDTYGVPVAILNGSHGGQPISWFQRLDSNPAWLGNNYGRLLWQAQEAGVTEGVRAILWYQGEADGADAAGHESGFIALHNDWLEDYPNVEQVYVCQVRPGCGDPSLDLRNRQRLLGDNTNLIVTVMSTMGLDGHDGCHYSYVDGYEELGNRMFNLLARDLYGAPALPNIDAPNPDRAYFSKADRSEITVELRDPDDPITFDAGAEAYFIVEGDSATVTNGVVSSNTLVLALSAPALDATGISYNGVTGSGPWVTNGAGLGLFAFFDEPIETEDLPEPAIFNDPPSNIDFFEADMNFNLTSTGQAATTVFMYWGPTDGGTDKAAWSNVWDFGELDAGQDFFYADSLAPDTTYYYRAYATNALGETWAPTVESVTTLNADPMVANGAVSNVTDEAADLWGEVIDVGAESPEVFLYWGPSQGGMDKAAWSNVVALGVQGAGPVSTPLSGLDPETAYFFRYYATNTYGDAWADGFVRFMTEAGPLDTNDFPHSMTVQFTGYDRGETLTNFPALVVLSEISMPTFRYSQLAYPDGRDLRFTAADGTTVLPFEVEKWDPSGESFIWVQVPELVDTNTQVIAHWGSTNLPVFVAAPDELPGLALWLDASVGVATNASGVVTNWADQSGNGNDASGVYGDPVRLPAAVGGKPALDFDGNDGLFGMSGIPPGDYTKIVVFRQDVLGTGNLLSSHTTVVGSRHALYMANSVYPRLWAEGNFVTSSIDVPLGDWAIIAGTYDAASNAGALMVNGRPAGVGVATVDNGDPGYEVGSIAGGANNLDGAIAEVLVFDRVLSKEEANAIGLYLEEKYGLVTVASDAPSYTRDGSTWDEKYEAVWHLDEATGQHQDASLNGHNSTVVSVVDQDATGIADGADEFGGAHYVQVPHTAALEAAAEGAMTLSAWARSDEPVGSSAFVVDFGATAGEGLGMTFSGGTLQSYYFGDFQTDTNGFATNTWYHLALVADGTTVQLHVNGVGSESDANSGGEIANFPLRIGAQSKALQSPRYMDGTIDEVRLESVARSTNWLWAVYRNVAENGTFAEYGEVTGVVLPLVENSAATEVLFETAVANGSLISTGASATTVELYWGEFDAGEDEFGWDGISDLGEQSEGPLAAPLSFLTPEMTYYYRYRGLNGQGASWAPETTSFTTLRAVPDVDNAGGATEITFETARLNGALVATNAGAATVAVYWGTSNGGTDPFSWDETATLPGTPAEGPVSHVVSNLAAETMYYYRYAAQNSFGITWADSVETFFTPADLGEFDLRVRIDFDGYDRDETLTNFPALVRLSEALPGFSYDQLLAGGGDLRFAAEDGTTVIPHEIEEWNTAGESVVWVQVPELTSNAYVYVYWGNTNLTDTLPGEIADLQLWLKADAGVETNEAGTVTNWVDQSSAGTDASQADTNLQPVVVSGHLNGLPVVRFDGAEELPFDGSILANTDYTIFLVEGRRSNKAGNYVLRGTALAANQNLHFGYRSDTVFTHAQFGNDYDMPVDGYSSQEFVVWASDSVAATASKHTWRNGALYGTKGNANNLSAYPGASIGGRGDYVGDVAEVLMFDRALTDAERASVELYLSRKYDLATHAVSEHTPPYAMDGSVWTEGYEGVWHMTTPQTPDAAGNGHDGTGAGTVTPTAGPVDGALHFDADTDYVSVPDSPVFTLSGDYTTTAWVRPDSVETYNGIMGTYNGQGFILALGNGRLQFWTGSTSWRDSGVTIPLNEWTSVGYSRSSTNGVFYVNGEPVTTIANAGSGTDGGPLHLGAGGVNWATFRFDGDTDEQRLSLVQRSSNWIWAAYANAASNAAFQTYGLVEGSPLPGISNEGGATAVSFTSATLNGSLITTGASPAQVTVYWGTTDGVTDKLAWDESAALGTPPEGALSTNVTGLLDGATYYYRYYATNDSGDAWAIPAETFSTALGRPLIVNTNGATNITAYAADLQGTLVATNGAATVVTIYYGTSDGGTDKLAWAESSDLGPQNEGPLLESVSALSDRTDYFYRYYASNFYGDAWADQTIPFRTPLDTQGNPQKLKITFSGYDRDEVLTNFPVLVVLNEGLANFSFNNFATEDAADLRVHDATETVELNYEIEDWDVNGDGSVWVQVPALTNGASVWVSWGDTNNMVAPAYTLDGSTWSEGYEAVWHLNETSGQFVDATASGYDSVAYHVVDRGTDGAAGGAADFEVSLTNFIEVAYSASLESALANPFTLSAWGRAESLGNNRFMVDLGETAVANVALVGQSSGSIFCQAHNDTLAVTGVVQLAQWYYAAMTIDASLNKRGYFDGFEQAHSTISSWVNLVNNPFRIGSQSKALFRGNEFRHFDGRLDEVRISTVVRSSNWVWAVYHNMVSNDVFGVYGAAVDIGGGVPDEDADGIPDDWELRYSTPPTTTGIVATANNDGDIYINSEEYVLDYSPTNFNDPFRLQSIALQSPLSFSFGETTNSRLYTVYFSSNLLEETEWIPLGPPTPGSNGVHTVEDPSDAVRRDYRIQVQVP